MVLSISLHFYKIVFKLVTNDTEMISRDWSLFSFLWDSKVVFAHSQEILLRMNKCLAPPQMWLLAWECYIATFPE